MGGLSDKLSDGTIYRPHRPHTNPTLIEPGAVYKYLVEIFPFGHVFRPGHKMIGHTGFLVTARRMAPGETVPAKKRRPAPGGPLTFSCGVACLDDEHRRSCEPPRPQIVGDMPE